MRSYYGRNYLVHAFLQDVFQDFNLPSLALVIARISSEICEFARSPHVSTHRNARYNWASRKLSKRLRQLGGQLFYDCGESDEQHPEGINGTFLPWVTGLRKKLIDHYPLMSGIAPLPDDVYLEPKWVLEAVKPNGQMPSQTELDSNSVMPKSQESHSFDDPIFVPGGVEATLLSNLRLTPDEHWQDVRFLELSTARREYYPGDVLTIYPKNFSEDVESILALMGWADHADDLIEFSPNLTLSSLLSAGPTPLAEAHGFLTLRKLLTDYLDITSIPRRSFFAAISHFTNDEVQKERLIEFTNPELVDELYDYTTRPRRSILEVLQEFHTVKIPLKYITSIIPFMRGRQFSIASGGALKQNTAGRSRVQLLIALVRYRTVLKKMRQGLCTRYISCLHPGTRITVSFSNSGLKVDYRRPSVMIGPGTGVAPLRSMIYEKAAMHKDLAQGLPKQLLFFGGRNRKADYFFESDWTSLSEQGNLDVITAFSRDGVRDVHVTRPATSIRCARLTRVQETKYYVQDAIRSHASLIYEVLQTGVVYVCG